jgi:hypothetical protein
MRIEKLKDEIKQNKDAAEKTNTKLKNQKDIIT